MIEEQIDLMIKKALKDIAICPVCNQPMCEVNLAERYFVNRDGQQEKKDIVDDC